MYSLLDSGCLIPTDASGLQTFEGKLVFNLDYNPDAIPRELAEEWTQAWVDTTALIA